jgi:hypothetical protein
MPVNNAGDQPNHQAIRYVRPLLDDEATESGIHEITRAAARSRRRSGGRRTGREGQTIPWECHCRTVSCESHDVDADLRHKRGLRCADRGSTAWGGTDRLGRTSARTAPFEGARPENPKADPRKTPAGSILNPSRFPKATSPKGMLASMWTLGAHPARSVPSAVVRSSICAESSKTPVGIQYACFSTLT